MPGAGVPAHVGARNARRDRLVAGPLEWSVKLNAARWPEDRRKAGGNPWGRRVFPNPKQRSLQVYPPFFLAAVHLGDC